MTLAQIVANIVGLALIAAIVWYFWLYQPERVVAAEARGVQEVRIRVRGGYDPDLVVARVGRPVRFHFYREEDTACSEMVVFPDLGQSAHLTPFQDTVVEVTPPEPGEYDFQCQMGMLRGKLVAEPP